MEKRQLIHAINALMPKTYGFAYAMSGDDLQAEQLVLDAYTVLLMDNEDYFGDEEFDLSQRNSRQNFNRFLLKELCAEVYHLAMKRAHMYRKNIHHVPSEYIAFHRLDVRNRALLYLKEVLNFSVVELQETLAMSRAQVIEVFYNASHEIINDKSSSLSEENSWS